MEKINPFGPLMALMQQDLQEYEEKYQGTFAEMPHISLGNSKTRCVGEATLPIVTCHASCLEKCGCFKDGQDIRFNEVK